MMHNPQSGFRFPIWQGMMMVLALGLLLRAAKPLLRRELVETSSERCVFVQHTHYDSKGNEVSEIEVARALLRDMVNNVK